jgi:SAM-dependent methyltransferase
MGIIATKRNVELCKAIAELADYLHEDPIATACNVGNSFYLVAEEWEKRNPKTPEEIHAYYENSIAYLWNLVFANYGIPHQKLWRVNAAYRCPGKRVLDLGAGIGSTLLECRAATTLTHADVGAELMSYAGWRYDNDRLSVSTVPLPVDYLKGNDPLAGQEYDLIICTEVIEHVPDPVALAVYLVGHLAPGGQLIASVSFEDDHGLFPCHLNTDRYKNEDFENRIFPDLGLIRIEQELYEKHA